MATTQKNREFAVTCSLGADVLLFSHMRGTEGLSQLSEYQLDLQSERSDLKIDKLLGTVLTVSAVLPRGGQRYFSGYITGFALAGRNERLACYRATVRPWLWFLTRAQDCRIFQEKNVVDILKEVFGSYSVADFDASGLSAQYKPLPYCVQYRESDFNFVMRLMEKAGIYYYFKCEAGRHKMVLADSYGAHGTAPKYESLPYIPTDKSAVRVAEAITDWTTGGEIQSGSCTLQDFDFEKPASKLQARSSVARQHDQAAYAVFDYPGGFVDNGGGEAYARARVESLHAGHEVIDAASTVRGIWPGCLFGLSGHPRADQNRDYLLVHAAYELHGGSYFSDADDVKDPPPPFQCTLVGIPKAHAWRAPQLTVKPVVQGPQTAIVVGKAGEEIWTDKYGRIKVQFHWDRVGADNEKSSCWMRVAQGWAGKRWGAVFIPRIGQEVIVSFLEGDPDQPLVTGSVYNATNMPPYPLPEKATRSGLKSNSSKGGGGFNEIRFEDKKGSEQLFLHAEKDLDFRIKNDARHWMGKDVHWIVKGNAFSEVGGTLHYKIVGDLNEKVGGTASLDTGKDIFYKAGKAFAVEAGNEIHLKAGANLVIEAGKSITLKAGGGSIVIGPASVAVTGKPILLNSGGAAGSGGGSSPTAPTAPKEADDGKK